MAVTNGGWYDRSLYMSVNHSLSIFEGLTGGWHSLPGAKGEGGEELRSKS